MSQNSRSGLLLPNSSTVAPPLEPQDPPDENWCSAFNSKKAGSFPHGIQNFSYFCILVGKCAAVSIVTQSFCKRISRVSFCFNIRQLTWTPTTGKYRLFRKPSVLLKWAVWTTDAKIASLTLNEVQQSGLLHIISLATSK